ncbi:MAG: hypothetical protein ACE5HZ_06900 [Fidelibacterota bacterium]
MSRRRAKRIIRITHRSTGIKLAEGPKGWAITPFEGNLYVRRKYLLTDKLKPNFRVGFCPYKFLYVWLDLVADEGTREKNLGWYYWLPNPLFPFIVNRIGLPRHHPALLVEEIT